MENLDKDVLENILFRLPLGKTLSQAKRVCKSWKTILDDRRHKEVGFLFQGFDIETRKLHLYFGQDYDNIDIGNKMMNNYYSHETLMEMEQGRVVLESCRSEKLVGSCNGLVCFQKYTHIPYEDFSEPVAVCNPLTGEFILLKDTLSSTWYNCVAYSVSCGFGYCLSTDEYKVVRFYHLKRSSKQHVQVYTIGSNEWRDVEPFRGSNFQSPGVFANGVLHWMDAVYTKETYIIAFDLEDEKLRPFPLPPSDVVKLAAHRLTSFGGNLCWVVQSSETRLDIWAYKRNNLNTSETVKEYDHKRDYYSQDSWNWVKDFSIEYDDHTKIKCSEVFAITKANQVLLLRMRSLFCYDLYCYNPNTRKISKLLDAHILNDDDDDDDDDDDANDDDANDDDDDDDDDDDGIGCTYIEAIRHRNSYVSLKDFGETWWYGPGCSPDPKQLLFDPLGIPKQLLFDPLGIQ